VRDFYAYVCAAKPGGYALTWSAWVDARTNAPAPGEPPAARAAGQP
jgi:hypothetical protein